MSSEGENHSALHVHDVRVRVDEDVEISARLR